MHNHRPLPTAERLIQSKPADAASWPIALCRSCAHWKSRAYLALACTLSLVVVGCGGSGEAGPGASVAGGEANASSGVSGEIDAPDAQVGAPDAAAGGPVEGDWIVIHLGAEPATLNPQLERADAYTMRIIDGNGGNVFETMLSMNMESLEYVPHIAERWEVSDDHLTYTFYFRKDVTFSDGTPLTAHDMKFTFDAIRDPANATADRRSYLVDFESCELLDDYTIQFKASKPYFLHLEVLGSLQILPKHIYEVGEFNTHENNRAPIGSGPYEFSKWDTGQQIILTKRDNYWGDKKPWVNALHFKIVTDDNAAIQLVRRGEIDEMRVRPEQWVRQTTKPEIADYYQRITMFSPVDGYASSVSWIGWNASRPVFSDNRVRKAMTMLLDRETIGETIFHGLVRTVSGTMFPGSDAYDNNIEPWPFDPEAAYALLDEAGWVDSNQDGIRDKDGIPFKYEWIYPSSVQEYEQMATVYKEELDKAGIEVTLRPLEWATFQESMVKREYDAGCMAWVSPIKSDPYQIWHSSQVENGSNYVNFVNAEADQIIEAARLEFNDDERNALYRRFHAILHEQQPYTFLYNSKRKVLVSKRFQNVKPYTLGFDMREWWVPADQQRYK